MDCGVCAKILLLRGFLCWRGEMGRAGRGFIGVSTAGNDQLGHRVVVAVAFVALQWVASQGFKSQCECLVYYADSLWHLTSYFLRKITKKNPTRFHYKNHPIADSTCFHQVTSVLYQN